MTTAAVRTSTPLPLGRMVMWWFLTSEIAIFGGLIVTYILLRSHHPEWAAYAGHTIDAAGATNTMVLLTSSFTVVLAHAAAHRGDHARASKLLVLTVLFGFAFLGIKTYEYSHEVAAGFTPVTNLFWSFYYLMTGLHGLHVVAGMVALGAVALGVRRHPERVEYAGMYWHLVDIVWIFLFPLLYLSS
jgi:heme/copper-type cytochrome/quinol oxidase subunit 3